MKRAIIIGASSGIGREVGTMLLEEGWSIGIAARRTGKLEEIKAGNPDKVQVMPIDVTHEDAGERLLELVGRMGGVDLFFYTSGIGKANPEVDTPTEVQTVEVNVTGFTRMVDTMFNYMAAHEGGHIAVVTSVAGTKGIGMAPSYSASKTYQSHYIQALEQLAHTRRLNIRFTDIRPGFVDTPLIEGRHYPLTMDVTSTARHILKAVRAHKHVSIIDQRYKILVFLWRMIPRCIWRSLVLRTK